MSYVIKNLMSMSYIIIELEQLRIYDPENIPDKYLSDEWYK